MNYDQFKTALGELGFEVPVPPVKNEKDAKKKVPGYGYVRNIPYTGLTLVSPQPYDHYYYGDNAPKPWEYLPGLVLNWKTGGTSGGSCWDNSEHTHYYSDPGNPEPNWSELDTILEHFCPSIPYLKYKKLMLLVRSESVTENEYYGNSTTYGLKILELGKLFQFLKDSDMLPTVPAPPAPPEGEEKAIDNRSSPDDFSVLTDYLITGEVPAVKPRAVKKPAKTKKKK